MIINGRSRRCVWWWSKHLQDENENESVRVVRIEGLASEDIHDLLCEIEAQGLGTRCRNPLWIAAINPGPKEYFSEQDRDRAREILEEERGYRGQPYFMVEHEKKGWKHWHVIYSRIDAEHMRTLPDGLDAKVCHAASRRIENELGLQKVIGPFDREPGMPRPQRGPEAWEMYRAMQTGIDPRDITAEVTELYRQSQNGNEFQAALELHGYTLATGRRGLLILDSAGKEHSLARRIDGVKTAQLNAFMRDLDRAGLPTVEQAKEVHQERKIAGLEADRATVRDEIEWQEALNKAAIAKEKTEQKFIDPEERAREEAREEREQQGAGSRKERMWPVNPPRHQSWSSFERAATDATRDDRTENLKGPAAKAWEAFIHSDSAQAFAAALDEKGIMFATVTKDEAQCSDRQAEFARAVGNRAPRFKEGEIVIVTEQNLEYRRGDQTFVPPRIHRIDQSLASKLTKSLDSEDRLKGIDETMKASDERAHQRSAAWQNIRLENAAGRRKPLSMKRVGKQASRAAVSVIRHAVPEAVSVVGKAAGIAGSFGKALDVIGGMVESLAAPTLTPAQRYEGEKARERREDEADLTIDFSRVTAEAAQQHMQQSRDREAERQHRSDERER